MKIHFGFTVAGGDRPCLATRRTNPAARPQRGHHQVPRVTAQRVRLTLTARRDTPHVAEIGMYDEPVRR